MLLPHAGTSQDSIPSQLHWYSGTESANIHLAADNIERENSPVPGPTPWASLVRLKGHVVIRTCCVDRPQAKSNPNPAGAYLIMRADSAVYHEDSGEIEAQGDVRISFQDRRPSGGK
jgi:hypothetical protein